MRLDPCSQMQIDTSLQYLGYQAGNQRICRLRTRSVRSDKARTQHHLMFVQTGRFCTDRNLVFARLDNYCTCRRRKTWHVDKASMCLPRMFVRMGMVYRLLPLVHGCSDRRTGFLILLCIGNLRSQFRHGSGREDTLWCTLHDNYNR